VSRKQRENLVPERCWEVVSSLSFLKVAVYTPECQSLCVAHKRSNEIR
jgi:hypothetical protein